MSVNELLDEIRATVQEVYEDLTEGGVNFAARLPVYREIYATVKAGNNPYKKTEGSPQLVGEPELLTVQNLYIGDVTSYKDGAPRVVGDARVKITQGLHTKEQLLGKGLPDGQYLLYRIGADLYTAITGGVRDPNGIAWEITLKKEPQ